MVTPKQKLYFNEVFGMDFDLFWNPLFKFDIERFCTVVNVPGDSVVEEFIKSKWGPEARSFIKMVSAL